MAKSKAGKDTPAAVESPAAKQTTSAKESIIVETVLETVHAVVYDSTGELVVHDDLISCEKFMSGMPTSVAKYVKPRIMVFENKVACDKWKEDNVIPAAVSLSAHTSKKQGTPTTAHVAKRKSDIHQEDKQGTPSPVAMAKRKSGVIDLEDDLPIFSLGGENQKLDSSTEIKAVSAGSPMAKKLKQLLQYRGMNMRVHYFTKIPGNPLIQAILIDMLDSKEWTHWCHRPSRWVEVFKYHKAETGESPNRFLETVRSVNARHKDFDKPDTTTVNNAHRTITLHRECMKGFLKYPLKTEKYIFDYLKSYLKPMYTDMNLQECYQVQLVNQYSRPNLINTVDPHQKETAKGSYWKMLEGAITQSQHLVPHESLNEIFLSSDIPEILRTMYPNAGLTDEMLQGKNISDELKLFAYGVM